MARPILHPTDFSRASAPAFRKALALARSMRRPLLIVHVTSPVAFLTGDVYASPAVYEELHRTAAPASKARCSAAWPRAS